MNNSNNHKSIDATLWEKRASMYKETFLNLLIKFSRLFYRAVENIRILHLGFLCFMLFNLSTAWAQSAEMRAAEGQTEIKPLEIGDTIPEQLWNLPLQVVNHPTVNDTITLNDYRNKKLIILDFWATWCAPCIASLKKLLPFQDQHSHDFAVIPYSNENIGMLKSRMEKLSFQILTAYGQELLNNYFPHKSIPHQIWIADGKLIHVDDGKNATAANLMAAMGGDVSSLEAKYEVLDFDNKQPLIQYALDAQTPVYL